MEDPPPCTVNLSLESICIYCSANFSATGCTDVEPAIAMLLCFSTPGAKTINPAISSVITTSIMNL